MRTIKSANFLALQFKKVSTVDIPYSYLAKGRPFVFLDSKDRVVGGFAIIDKKPFRTIEQIPLKIYAPIKAENEITAYFIADKKYGFAVTLRLVLEVLKSKGPFVYSYDLINKSLQRYYALGDPELVYSGPVKNLPGMEGLHYENVEILTKLGIVKLFIKRTLRGILK